MKANEFYNYVKKRGVKLECNCTNISQDRFNDLMKGAVRANKKIVNKLVGSYFHKLHLNPYPCYRTKTHIILVHSLIEYFFKIK